MPILLLFGPPSGVLVGRRAARALGVAPHAWGIDEHKWCNNICSHGWLKRHMDCVISVLKEIARSQDVTRLACIVAGARAAMSQASDPQHGIATMQQLSLRIQPFSQSPHEQALFDRAGMSSWSNGTPYTTNQWGSRKQKNRHLPGLAFLTLTALVLFL